MIFAYHSFAILTVGFDIQQCSRVAAILTRFADHNEVN